MAPRRRLLRGSFDAIRLTADRGRPPIPVLWPTLFVLFLAIRRAKEIRRERDEVLVRPEHVEQVWSRRRGRHRDSRTSRLAPGLEPHSAHIELSSSHLRSPGSLRGWLFSMPYASASPGSHIDAPDHLNILTVRRRAAPPELAALRRASRIGCGPVDAGRRRSIKSRAIQPVGHG